MRIHKQRTSRLFDRAAATAAITMSRARPLVLACLAGILAGPSAALAVTGGFVYHGAAIPALQNHSVFGDWGSFTSPSGRLLYLDATNGISEFRIGLEDRPLGFWMPPTNLRSHSRSI